MLFSKRLECLDCGFKGKAAHEITFCPNCLSDQVLTMTNKQYKATEKRQAVFAEEDRASRQLRSAAANLRPL